MWRSHGDQKSEKTPLIKCKALQNNWPSKNMKIWTYGVTLTWDRTYDTFEQKNIIKHFMKI